MCYTTCSFTSVNFTALATFKKLLYSLYRYIPYTKLYVKVIFYRNYSRRLIIFSFARSPNCRFMAWVVPFSDTLSHLSAWVCVCAYKQSLCTYLIAPQPQECRGFGNTWYTWFVRWYYGMLLNLKLNVSNSSNLPVVLFMRLCDKDISAFCWWTVMAVGLYVCLLLRCIVKWQAAAVKCHLQKPLLCHAEMHE